MIIKPSIVIMIGFSLSPKYVVENPVILKEYKSPTMNYDPFQNYKDNQTQKLMDSILIDQIRNEIDHE